MVGQDASMIGDLKKDLFKAFDMKDLGPARQILGMEIAHWLSQEKYAERILERFNMKHAKPVGTPLGGHSKLSKKSCPSSMKEKENMASVPYSLFLCNQESCPSTKKSYSSTLPTILVLSKQLMLVI